VLDVALDPDPNNRYQSATMMAHALAQVMKQAVGIDPQSALGQAVRDMRAKARGEVDVSFSQDIDLSTADFNVEAIELTSPKKPKPPG
jgi:hypothetical protein